MKKDIAFKKINEIIKKQTDYRDDRLSMNRDEIFYGILLGLGIIIEKIENKKSRKSPASKTRLKVDLRGER